MLSRASDDIVQPFLSRRIGASIDRAAEYAITDASVAGIETYTMGSWMLFVDGFDLVGAERNPHHSLPRLGALMRRLGLQAPATCDAIDRGKDPCVSPHLGFRAQW